ncbi:MAG: response regulator [Bacteroidales bacterium]|jgi:signal transduction histidine kinase
MNKKFTILYVDDEISNLNVFKNTFRRDYNIFTAESAKKGLKILDREHIDLILSDQRMPEINGVDFLKKVMQKYPEPSRILITAFTDFGALKNAVNEARIFQYIQKPWDEEEIKQTLDGALEIYNLKQKNLQLTGELRKKNKELDRLNKELIELDSTKFQFLQIISHEIRTPLNGLVGATSLFKDVFKNEDFREYKQLFGMLEASVQRLTRFMLLAQRITSLKTEGYKIYPGVVNVNRLITDTLKSIEKKLSEKNIRTDIDLCADDRCDCYAEKQLIEISIYEILDNAIKYSADNGIISIKTSVNKDKCFLEISDNGPGFSDDVLRNIFKPFIADEDISKQGMGLNLALIKLIIEAHNGNISILNNENGGASVRLTIMLHGS